MSKTKTTSNQEIFNTIIKNGIERVEPETVTQKRLEDLQNQRNKLIPFINGSKYFSNQFESINLEIISIISEMSCYKTLKLLMSKNATIRKETVITETETEETKNGKIDVHGFNMALTLYNNLYNDIKIMNNPEIITDIITDSGDLLQVAKLTLLPYFANPVPFKLSDTLYTITLKNGNVKNYNAFDLTCKSIRKYIDNQDKKQYKKMYYVEGYTESNTEVLTTKKPENDITDIETETKEKFVSRYNLTTIEENIILSVLNNCDYKATMENLHISKDMFYRALKSAKEKILQADKRIKL